MSSWYLSMVKQVEPRILKNWCQLPSSNVAASTSWTNPAVNYRHNTLCGYSREDCLIRAWSSVFQKLGLQNRCWSTWTTSQAMPLGPMMALSLWRLIALRKDKVSRKGKTKAVDLLEVNGLASSGAFGRGRGRGRTNKGKGKGKTKGKSKGEKGNQKGNAKGRKGGGRGKVVYGQCSNCLEYGHWSRDCPNMVNQVSNKQEPIPPSQTTSTTTPVAKAAPGATVRRVFQFGNAVSNPSSPTPPTSPCLCHERMVLFHDPEPAWTEIDGECDHEWVILDTGSNVRLLPPLYRADDSSILGAGSVQNNRGGTRHTTGTKKAELIAVTTGGWGSAVTTWVYCGERDVLSCVLRATLSGWLDNFQRWDKWQLESSISWEWKRYSRAIQKSLFCHQNTCAENFRCFWKYLRGNWW